MGWFGCWSTPIDGGAIMRKIIILFLLLLTAASLTLAQANSFTLDWWTVEGGGGMSGNGRYTLQATIGQPDAGEMRNGRYALLAGYWDISSQYPVYLPVAIRP